jgi:hypothetical protein
MGTKCNVCGVTKENFFSQSDKPICPECFDKFLNKLKHEKEVKAEKRSETIKNTPTGSAI